MITLIRADNRSFRFDAVINPSVVRPGTATQHPITEGAAATDHIQEELSVITFIGVVTEDPLQGPIPDLAGPERVQRAIEFLTLARKGFITVVYSGVGIFRNCLLPSFPSTRDDGVQAEKFDITLVETRVVQSRSIRIVLPRQPSNTVADEAPTTQDIGPQAPQAVTPADDQKGSLAVRGLIRFGVVSPR